MKKYFALLLSFVLAFSLTACSDAETKKAKSSFEETASIVEKNNETINKDVKALQKLTKSKVKPLDDTVLKKQQEKLSAKQNNKSLKFLNALLIKKILKKLTKS